MGEVVDLARHYMDQLLSEASRSLVRILHDDIMPLGGHALFEIVANSLAYYIDKETEIGARAIYLMTADDTDDGTYVLAFCTNYHNVVFTETLITSKSPKTTVEPVEEAIPSIFMQIELRPLPAKERLSWRGLTALDKSDLLQQYCNPLVGTATAGCFGEGAPWPSSYLGTIPCRLIAALLHSDDMVVHAHSVEKDVHQLSGIYTGGDRQMELAMFADFPTIYREGVTFLERIHAWKNAQ